MPTGYLAMPSRSFWKAPLVFMHDAERPGTTTCQTDANAKLTYELRRQTPVRIVHYIAKYRDGVCIFPSDEPMGIDNNNVDAAIARKL